MAEQISQRLGAPRNGEWVRWLAETVGSLEPTDRALIEAIAALGIPIATTNYDGLLERVTNYPPVTWEKTDVVVKILRNEATGILHLHGYWDEPSSVVLGIRDYQNILGAETAQHVQRILPTLHGMLYIGCGAGLGDPNFAALRAWIRTFLTGTTHRNFRLACDGDIDALKKEHNLDERTFVLGFGPKHRDLAPFLKELVTRMAPPSPVVQPPPVSLNSVPTKRDPSTINIGRLPFPRIDSIGREEDLKDLSNSWNNRALNVLSLIAAGGAGKTALVRAWLTEMERQDYDGACRILGWSFESGKFNDPAASADEFIAEALEFFGESTFDQDSPWANGERLADHIRQGRNLLILDGLETLQSNRPVEYGAIKDPALATLITELARNNTGLCIITSRVPVADISRFRDQAIPKNLEKLSPQAGRRILQQAGVQGGHLSSKKQVMTLAVMPWP